MSLELNTDDEFMSLCIPASDTALNELRQSLLLAGCQNPIIAWHGIILDGHKRINICKAENIEYDVVESDFLTREEAMIYICRERIPDVASKNGLYRYLVGKWYMCLRKLSREYKAKYNKNLYINDDIQWRERMSMIPAEKLGVGFTSVEKYGRYSVIMDIIRSIDPDMFRCVMSGSINIPMNVINDAPLKDKETTYNICRKYVSPDLIKMRVRTFHKKGKNKNQKTITNDFKPLNTKVKEMPQSDPDRELRGLTFTVPMWISSISRSIEHTDIKKATNTAKSQLADALNMLIAQINITLEELK